MGASLFPLPSAAQYLSQPRHKSLPKFQEYVPEKKEVIQQDKKPETNRTPSRNNSVSSKKCIPSLIQHQTYRIMDPALWGSYPNIFLSNYMHPLQVMRWKFMKGRQKNTIS